jgi:hypothetical protein
MSSGVEMLNWWNRLKQPERDAWCAHASDHSLITKVMADDIADEHKGHIGPKTWITSIVAVVDHVTADVTWQMVEPFRTFIGEQCDVDRS